MPAWATMNLLFPFCITSCIYKDNCPALKLGHETGADPQLAHNSNCKTFRHAAERRAAENFYPVGPLRFRSGSLPFLRSLPPRWQWAAGTEKKRLKSRRISYLPTKKAIQ
jgi:hypothetical protein